MHLMYQEVANKAIKCGGKLFGGYVRDFVLREHAAKKFYKSNSKEMYADTTVSPETSDRLLLPNDLDICFPTAFAYKQFRRSLKESYYNCQVTNVNNVYGKGRHIKLVARLDIGIGRILGTLDFQGMAKEVIKPHLAMALQGLEIQGKGLNIDVIICKTDPHYLSLDFRCNGLLMTSNGIELCEELKSGLDPIGIYRITSSVIEEIERKEAVVVNLNGKRWDKMVEKGWKITGSAVEKVFEKSEDCLICLQTVETTDMYKLSCCSAKYHIECLSKQITYPERGIVDSGRCAHCRRALFMSPKEVETFGAIVENFF